MTSIMLEAFLLTLNLHLYDDLMFFAGCCLAFCGFLRVSEFCAPSRFGLRLHLSLQDLLVGASRAQLRLKSSKTDIYRKGVWVPLACSRGPVCAVKALTAFLRRRPRGLESSFKPLFIHQDGRPMLADWFSRRLQRVCSRHGFLGRVSSHSLRIGAATSAAQAGIPDHVIKELGRWSSECFKTYIRIDPDVLERAVARMTEAHRDAGPSFN